MFKFPLQRLLDLKAKKEQDMARQLAGARRDAEAERGVRDTLAATHADACRHMAQTAGEQPTVGQLVSMSYTIAQLSERVTAADERASAADKVVDARHDELTAAVRDRQVLDRLRGKRLENHKSEENARDRQAMDAIALSRFTSPSSTKAQES
jgi:flagellar protein FliJ